MSVYPNISRLSTVLALVAMLFCWCGAQGPHQTKYTLLKKYIPDFVLPTLDGKKFHSSDLKGNATALFAFCSCDKCKQVANDWTLSHAKPDAKSKAVIVFLGDKEEATTFLAQHPFDMANTIICYDENFTVSKLLRASPCPTAFVVDKNAIVRYSTKEPASGKEPEPSEISAQVVNIQSVVAEDAAAPILPKAVIPKEASLTPLPSKNATVVEDNGLFYEDKKYKVKSVRKSFSFRNNSETSIPLERATGTCECTQVTVTKNGKVIQNTEIQPGETITLSVTVTIPLDFPAKMAEVWIFGYSLNPIGFVRMHLVRPHRGS